MPKKTSKEPSKDLLKEVGERIAATMREKKVTQAEMGAYLDISQAAVSAWNNGSDPGCEKIVKIAEKLGVSVGYLLTGEAPSPNGTPPNANPSTGEIGQLEKRIKDLKEQIQDYKDRERYLLSMINEGKKDATGAHNLARSVIHR